MLQVGHPGDAEPVAVTAVRFRRVAAFLERIRAFLFGDDIFISYARADTTSYAAALARRLARRGFSCYLDQWSTFPGRTLPDSLEQAVRRSGVFVLLASSSAKRSEHVTSEVEVFATTKRPFILVQLCPDLKDARWSELTEGAATTIDLQRLPAEVPSRAVVDRIINSFTARTKNQRLGRAFWAILGGTATVLAVGYAVGQLVISRAEQEKMTLTKEVKTIAGERDTLTVERGTLRERNGRLISTNDTLSRRSEDLQATVEDLGKKRTELSNDNAALQQKQAELTANYADLLTRRRVVATRLAVARELARDPGRAFRLAERLWEISPVEDSRRLLLNAASSLVLSATAVVQDCTTYHSNDPFVLLQCGSTDSPTWKVLDTRTGTLRPQPIPFSARRAWIAPAGDDASSWRVVTSRYLRSQNNLAVLSLDVLDRDGVIVYSMEDGAVYPTFCPPQRVVVHRNQLGRLEVLDLVTNRPRSAAARVGGPFLVACNKDRILTGGGNAFEVFDADLKSLAFGEVKSPTYPNMNDEDGADWSPDGRFVAVARPTPGGRYVSILDVSASSFTPIAVEPTISTAWEWESGHDLTLSTHTRDKSDYRLFTVDATQPSLVRASQQTPTAVRSIAASPGEDQRVIVNINGDVTLVRRSDGQVLGVGHHEGAFATRVGPFLLSSSSAPRMEVRQWTPQPTTQHWVFESNATRTYVPCAAGDPQYRWLAAAFVEGKTLALDVRSVGGNVRLPPIVIPGPVTSCSVLAFSSDGRWLLMTGANGGVLFSTDTWRGEPLPFNFLWGTRIIVGPDRFLVSEELTKEGRPSLETAVVTAGPAPSYGKWGPTEGTSSQQWNECMTEGITWPIVEFFSLIDGWQQATAQSPSTRTLLGCKGSGWVAKALRKVDRTTNIEFIPVDPNKLRAVFDAKVARISPTDLDRLVEEEIAK